MNDKYKCQSCSSNQISIEENSVYTCFDCGYTFYMLRHQVGDKIKVRADLDSGKHINVAGEMETLRGRILTVNHIESNGYRVEENHWFWSDAMLDD